MPTCKLIKKIAAVSALTLIAPALYSQTKKESSSLLDFPSISIESPKMPSLSAPTIGEGYYVPNTVSSNIYNGQKSRTEKPVEKKEQKTSVEEVVKSMLPNLSAQDISAMGNLGMLTSFASPSVGNTDSTQASLQLVLNELDKIKTQNEKLLSENAAKNTGTTPAKDYVLTQAQTEEKTTVTVPKPKILRFSVNSYDILKTCKTIYISSVQDDGSFLVTGDRRYLSDGKTRKETFYIYFRTQKDTTGLSNYAVAASVSQDYLNEYSFLYQMSQKENLTAIRTGNLLTIHTTDSNWQLDFLVDLGDEK